MDGIATVLGWATGSIEGIAFVELLILIAVILLWRELRAVNRRIDRHEEKCDGRETATQERFSSGATKMALLDERTKSIQDDVREIKDALRR